MLDIGRKHGIEVFRKKLNSGIPKYWGSKVGVFGFLCFFQVLYLGHLKDFIRVLDVVGRAYLRPNFKR